MKSGELEVDLTRGMDGEGCGDAAGLVERKRAGERTGIVPSLVEAWRPRVMKLFDRLDEARDASPLPEAPVNEREIRDWLLDARRSRFEALPLRSRKD